MAAAGGGGMGSPKSPNGYGSSPLHSPNNPITGGGGVGSYPGVQTELSKEFSKFNMVSSPPPVICSVVLGGQIIIIFCLHHSA